MTTKQIDIMVTLNMSLLELKQAWNVAFSNVTFLKKATVRFVIPTKDFNGDYMVIFQSKKPLENNKKLQKEVCDCVYRNRWKLRKDRLRKEHRIAIKYLEHIVKEL